MKTTAPDGSVINWDRSGPADAPAVVMLHSLGSDRRMWHPQVDLLARRWSMVCIDMRGHGESDVPAGPYDLETLAGDVLAVVDDAGLDRFHVVGLSIGGQIALWLAAHVPERVVSMTACNTGARIGTEESWGARIAAVDELGMAGLAPSVLERWFSPDFGARRPEWLQQAADTLRSTSADGYSGCCGALATADLREVVGSIAVPSLIVAGALDLSTTPDMAEWLRAAIPGARLEVIPGAAHVSNLDRSEDFNAAFGSFLGSIPGAG